MFPIPLEQEFVTIDVEKSRFKEGVVVINVDKKKLLDNQTINLFFQPQLEKCIRVAKESMPTIAEPIFLLDMSKIEYMSAAVIKVMERTHKRLHKGLDNSLSRGNIMFCGLNNNLSEVFEVTRFDEKLYITPEEIRPDNVDRMAQDFRQEIKKREGLSR